MSAITKSNSQKHRIERSA